MGTILSKENISLKEELHNYHIVIFVFQTVFLFQRWNDGRYSSYDPQSEKARLYRNSKDQVII